MTSVLNHADWPSFSDKVIEIALKDCRHHPQVGLSLTSSLSQLADCRCFTQDFRLTPSRLSCRYVDDLVAEQAGKVGHKEAFQ